MSFHFYFQSQHVFGSRDEPAVDDSVQGAAHPDNISKVKNPTGELDVKIGPQAYPERVSESVPYCWKLLRADDRHVDPNGGEEGLTCYRLVCSVKIPNSVSKLEF